MKFFFISSIKSIDNVISRLFFRSFQEKPSLMMFVFHGLFRDKKEIDFNFVHPQQGITIEYFKRFIEYFLDNNYLFVSPGDILEGLNNDKKYTAITFDDGYYNNIYALPVLKEYKVPAVFFISTNNIKYNKCFWWDVLYRERIKLGVSEKDITRESEWLKSKTNEGIEKYLMNQFGKEVFYPIGDIDRPFSPSELKDFSKEKYVFLGNHTCDHAILTNYSLKEISSQILGAQQAIYDMTGVIPISISYPNGNYSKEIVNISKANALRIGVTSVPGKNYLPIDFKSNTFMCLRRFTLWGNTGVIDQCKMFRSDIAIYPVIRNLFQKILDSIRNNSLF